MSILDDIAAYKRQEIVIAKAKVPPAEIEARAKAASPARGFRAALASARAEKRIGLIAEIKKASPSKGLIRADFDVPSLARAYESGGATCLSVLTDAPSFQGAPEFLAAARARLPPCRSCARTSCWSLIKSREARAWGADAILVIMAMVDDTAAAALIASARAWGMDALVEIHDEPELKRAVALGADLIGINNRDLKTFTTELETTLWLAPRVPPEILIVAESGLSRREDLALLAKAGVTTFLIGEGLMRQNDVAAATAALIGAKLIP